MAEKLTTVHEGEDILASVTNDNNQYLLSKLSDNALQVQKYVEGEVATIKSNVASVQTTLQGDIDILKNGVGKSTAYIIESFVDGGAGYDVYSNGKIVQWGTQYHSGSNKTYDVQLLKPFSNGDYVVTGSWSASPKVGDKGLMWACNNKGTDHITLKVNTSDTNSQTCYIYWRAEGY